MEHDIGAHLEPTTPERIAEDLRAAGPGAHAVVGIDRDDGTGHWFNAYFDGTNVWYVDGESGMRGPWPPDNFPDAVAWDASIFPYAG